MNSRQKLIRALHVEVLRSDIIGECDDSSSIELLLLSGIDLGDYMNFPSDAWKVDVAIAHAGGYDLADATLEAISLL